MNTLPQPDYAPSRRPGSVSFFFPRISAEQGNRKVGSEMDRFICIYFLMKTGFQLSFDTNFKTVKYESISDF